MTDPARSCNVRPACHIDFLLETTYLSLTRGVMHRRMRRGSRRSLRQIVSQCGSISGALSPALRCQTRSFAL